MPSIQLSPFTCLNSSTYPHRLSGMGFVDHSRCINKHITLLPNILCHGVYLLVYLLSCLENVFALQSEGYQLTSLHFLLLLHLLYQNCSQLAGKKVIIVLQKSHWEERLDLDWLFCNQIIIDTDLTFFGNQYLFLDLRFPIFTILFKFPYKSACSGPAMNLLIYS